MVSRISAEIIARRGARTSGGTDTGFLVLDTESIPDGARLARVKYRHDDLTPQQAIERAQAEARELSRDGSDFLPVTFQVPVAVCVLRVGADLTLQALTCLDAPHFRTPEIVRQFWKGVAHYPRARLVTFNGRGFDMPLLELAALEHGCQARDYFYNSRNRFQGNHLDLLDWMTNYGAYRLNGGLHCLADIVRGGPAPRPPHGKLDVAGNQVHAMYLAGQHQEINDYCMFDTLDTYFVFLRSRVLVGERTLDQERDLVRRAREWLVHKRHDLPALDQYLAHWEPD